MIFNAKLLIFSLAVIILLSKSHVTLSFLIHIATSRPTNNAQPPCMLTSSSFSSSTSNTVDQSITLTENKNDILKAIGVPKTIQNLAIGQSLKAFRRNVPVNDDMSIKPMSNFTIERVATSPDIFVLRNFLSHYECDTIINYYVSNDNCEYQENNKMTNAETITKDDITSRKHCKVAWLPSSPPSSTSPTIPSTISSIISNLVSSTANILLSKQVLNHPSSSVEDLQVLKYEQNGEFILHHDGEPRILTVIYYLNGVAGTWFPLATTNLNHDPCKGIKYNQLEQDFISIRNNNSRSSNDYNDAKDDDPQNKVHALELGQDFEPGKNGLLIKGTIEEDESNEQDHLHRVYHDKKKDNDNIVYIQKGDAVAFYNYKNDGSGKLNWKALHAGLPVTTGKENDNSSVKWIANHWFRLGHLCDDQ